MVKNRLGASKGKLICGVADVGNGAAQQLSTAQEDKSQVSSNTHAHKLFAAEQLCCLNCFTLLPSTPFCRGQSQLWYKYYLSTLHATCTFTKLYMTSEACLPDTNECPVPLYGYDRSTGGVLTTPLTLC
jgi:hypothetical protein